ncbi:uncharacterized protein LOC114521147 [Dendronephthya gigantea]|uniref:uncharacterized protein LOC114521147 n=1 Tax=Dendronephthya gigantea TaxID=151771 RepID=UPI0010694E84|nr:uncharacterized protein LOC114521147 [Dendronephthya gigantea]
MPLEISCDDSMQRSKEAAMSITNFTPSPSSSSSMSDSCEMTTPDPLCNSTPSVNPPSLLSTMDNRRSPLEIPDLRLDLGTPQDNQLEGEVNPEHDNTNSSTRVGEYTQSGSMELDPHLASDNKQCPTWSVPPTNTPYPSSNADDRHAAVEISDLYLILESTQNTEIGEEMDCLDDRNSTTESVYMNPGSMNIDSHVTNSVQQCPSLSSPDCSPPVRYTRASVRRSATTPEDVKISRFAANLTADSPQISPAFALRAEKRMLRRRNMYEGFKGYKEPSLNRKMRQGDPFSDSSLFQPKRGLYKKQKTKRQIPKKNLDS